MTIQRQGACKVVCGVMGKWWGKGDGWGQQVLYFCVLGRENVRLETRRAYRRWCRVGYLSQCPGSGYWMSNAYWVIKPNCTPVCLWDRLGYRWHAFGAWEAASPAWHWTPVSYSPYCSSRGCCNWAVPLSLLVPASLSPSYHQALTRSLPALAGVPRPNQV